MQFTLSSFSLVLCVVIGHAAAALDGPLRVCAENPRYFSDASGEAIYLTGSHTWNNLLDMNPNDPPNPFDYQTYVDWMTGLGHNFMRLWVWEMTVWNMEWSGFTDVHNVAPQPWPRTGPGLAHDGKPKFDLGQFDSGYFSRLRSRVMAAGTRSIYVSVMLFEGWGLQRSDTEGWLYHPFNADNNINGIDGDPNEDGRGLEVHTLDIPAVLARQEAYVRHVVDTVNDLDNVLYEIANESHPGSRDWQYHMIDLIKDYEAGKPEQHPVGMTIYWHGMDNSDLYSGPADWVSPGRGEDFRDDPPDLAGAKVILSDTDHLWGLGGTRTWVWKSFTRGINPIYMDAYLEEVIPHPAGPVETSVRANMGYTRAYAEGVNLTRMTPRNDLASSAYCLADAGQEYLVYLPEGGQVTVDLSDASGSMAVEWFEPETGATLTAAPVSGGGQQAFTSPFGSSDAVLYLKDPKPVSGGKLTASVPNGWLEAGMRLELSAPAGGSDYAFQIWNGSSEEWEDLTDDPPRVVGHASGVLVFDPVWESDEGFFRCAYTLGSALVTDPYLLLVLPAGSLPQASPLGLAVLCIGLGVAGAALLSMERRGRAAFDSRAFDVAGAARCL